MCVQGPPLISNPPSLFLFLFPFSMLMENSASSRICTYEQEGRCQATSFHDDSRWTSSSMDDLLMFDDHITLFSSSYEYFQTRLCSSAAAVADQPSPSSPPKRRKMVADDDLEDTATSPPHPAMISKMGALSSKQKKRQKAMINQIKVKGKKSEDNGEVEDRVIEVGFVGRDKNCSTGLKNIGLCLVPVSMAVNYFG